MNEILDFIRRRFPTDCHWLDGNCYYFAVILKARFPDGKIFYDAINGHFVFLIIGKYYDWTGEIEPDGELIEWQRLGNYDRLWKERIIRDCVR